MRTKLIAAVATSLLVAPVSAEAHELTCSTSRWSHWPDIRKHPSVKVDDLPGVRCFDRGRDKITLTARTGRWLWAQDIRRLGETDLPGPFYWNVKYDIKRPFATYTGR